MDTIVKKSKPRSNTSRLNTEESVKTTAEKVAMLYTLLHSNKENSYSVNSRGLLNETHFETGFFNITGSLTENQDQLKVLTFLLRNDHDSSMQDINKLENLNLVPFIKFVDEVEEENIDGMHRAINEYGSEGISLDYKRAEEHEQRLQALKKKYGLTN